jgi:hypothetical protein
MSYPETLHPSILPGKINGYDLFVKIPDRLDMSRKMRTGYQVKPMK